MIEVTTSKRLTRPFPLDDKYLVANVTDENDLVASNEVYEGMLIYRSDSLEFKIFKSGTFEVISTTGGIAEAPIDGQQYARKDAAWDVVAAAGATPPAGTEREIQINVAGSFAASGLFLNDAFAGSLDLGTNAIAGTRRILATTSDTTAQLVLTYQSSSSGYVSVQPATISHDATLQILSPGTTDTYLRWDRNGNTYSMGIDESDSDKIKLTTGSSVSLGLDLFNATPAGLFTFNNNVGGGNTTDFLRADGQWIAPITGGAPGGVDRNIQFNDAGSFGGSANFIYNETLATSQYALTIKSTAPGGSTGYNGIELDVTETLGSTLSTNRLIALRANGTERFSIFNDGSLLLNASGGGSIVQSTEQGTAIINKFSNSNGSSSASIGFRLVTAPNGGDPYMQFGAGASVDSPDFTYVIGVDNSDVNKFKINYGTSAVTPSTGTNFLTVDTSGLFTFNGNVGGGDSLNFLRADGIWSVPASAPAGANTQVQFNDNGVFGASANFVYNSTSDFFRVGNVASDNFQWNSGTLFINTSTGSGLGSIFMSSSSTNGTISMSDDSGTIQTRITADSFANGNFMLNGLALGTSSPNTNVIFHCATTDAIIIPVGTTGDQPAGAVGMMRFNSTDVTFEGYDGTSWIDLGASGGATPPAGSNTQIQFNSANSFGASSNLTWNGSSFVVGIVNTDSFQVTPAGVISGYSSNIERVHIDPAFGRLWLYDNSGNVDLRFDSNGLNNYINTSFGINTTTTEVDIHLKIGGTGAMRLPFGTSAERPATTGPAGFGMFRSNTDTDEFEGYLSSWRTLLSINDSGVASINLPAPQIRGIGNGGFLLGAGVTGDSASERTFINMGTGTGLNEFQIFTGGDGTVGAQLAMTIDGNQNVGIGTNTPTAILHVVGDQLSDGNPTINGSPIINGRTTINMVDTIGQFINNTTIAGGNTDLLISQSGTASTNGEFLRMRSDGTDRFIFNANGTSSFSGLFSLLGGLNLQSVPTTLGGLNSGDVWNDGGILKIAP